MGVTPARNRIEIDRYSSISGGATIAFLDETAPFEGWKTIFPTKGASVDYNRVDFGNHPVSEIVVRAKSASAARIAVKAGGKLVAMVDIPKTTEWRKVRVKVKQAPKGINDISVTLIKGNMAEIDYIGFDMLSWEQGAMRTGKYRNVFAEMDYSWSCADREWQQQYANRIQDFLYSKGIDTFLDQYNIDGSEPDDILEAGGYKKLRHSVGFVATSAAASLAATHVKSREFIERLWNSKHEPYEDGYFDAYYDGLVRLFALMHLSGRYRIILYKNENNNN